MKQFLLVCYIFLATTQTTIAFEKAEIINGEISGKVLDANLNQPLPYVNIIITNNDGKTITGGITLEDGTFKIDQIPEGKYNVNIQYIGFKSETRSLSIDKKSFKVDFGIIKLEESTEGLDEVTIVAETSSVVQKIDRKVINVGKDLISAGATASELLSNVQSVNVDSQSGNLSLRGNENVRVLIDGKPSNIPVSQLLQQIPSTSIKQIELITNPSAKYNPEGMSGIINIVLHKNANQGFNGNITAGVVYGKNARVNSALGMNYKTGKVNFYTNYGQKFGDYSRVGLVRRIENDAIQNFKVLDETATHLLKFGVDFYLNKNNTLSAYIIQNKFDGINFQDVLITENNVLVADNYNKSDNDNNDQTYNLHYKLDLVKTGHSIEFESNYSSFKGNEYAISEESINSSDNFLNYTNDVKNIRKNTLLNLDYTNPLSETSKLEIGLEYRFNESKNNSDTTQHEFLLDNSGNQIPDGFGGFETQDTPIIDFTYDRHIYSAYANYNKKFNKINMQLGARLEQYEIEGNFNKGSESLKVTDEIFTIYPSAFFTFNPSEKNQFQVSYSRRVDRPSLEQINPIRQWSTPRITNIGNPSLNPQFTNSYEVNYTREIKNGSFSLGTFYRRVNNNINRVLNTDPLDNNKVLLSYSNTGSNNRYGIEASLNYKAAKWWSINTSADLYTQKQSGIANGDELEVTNNAFNIRLNNSFTASENLRFQLFYMYQGGGKNLQFERSSMTTLNAGTSLSVLKKKGSINFRVNDIFKGMRFRFDTDRPYPGSGQFNWESQTAYLSFDYRFGGGKNQALKRRKRDNNEASGGGGF